MRRNLELLAALAAAVLVTPLYLYLARSGIPESGAAPAHWLGVIGMALMLATEILYSLRKRLRGVHFGRLRTWLSVHIFMGIFGPYLVLLHTAWRFQGLAGIATLFTVLVVISGFVGRYIYTSIPRTAGGVEMEANQVADEIAALNTRLQEWLAGRPAALRTLAGQMLGTVPVAFTASSLIPDPGKAFEFGPVRLPAGSPRSRWSREVARLAPGERRQVLELEKLLGRRAALDRQLGSLARARRLMALWHTVHVPLGMVLFTAATLHVLAALFFHTLGR
jgi:hypothetical protein